MIQGTTTENRLKFSYKYFNGANSNVKINADDLIKWARFKGAANILIYKEDRTGCKMFYPTCELVPLALTRKYAAYLVSNLQTY